MSIYDHSRAEKIVNSVMKEQNKKRDNKFKTFMNTQQKGLTAYLDLVRHTDPSHKQVLADSIDMYVSSFLELKKQVLSGELHKELYENKLMYTQE